MVPALLILAHGHAMAVKVHLVGGHVEAHGRDDVGKRQILLGHDLEQGALKVLVVLGVAVFHHSR